MKKRFCILLSALLALFVTACAAAPDSNPVPTESPDLLDVPNVARAFAGDTQAPDFPSVDDYPDLSGGAEYPTASDYGGASVDPVIPDDRATSEIAESATPEISDSAISESGSYTTKEDVALYLHLYGHLPGNFITKKEARSLGWSGGSLEEYASGKCIGGDRFGNYEGLLPQGKSYRECDIDTLGAKSRGAKRLVYSDDGLIYYTADHYNTFTLLYGDP